jgi:hypothetical protein
VPEDTASNDAGGASWVREPGGGPPTVAVTIEIPQGAQVGPELMAAVEDFLRALEAATGTEMQGQGLTCTKGSCRPMVEGPCATHVTCAIGD